MKTFGSLALTLFLISRLAFCPAGAEPIGANSGQSASRAFQASNFSDLEYKNRAREIIRLAMRSSSPDSLEYRLGFYFAFEWSISGSTEGHFFLGALLSRSLDSSEAMESMVFHFLLAEHGNNVSRVLGDDLNGLGQSTLGRLSAARRVHVRAAVDACLNRGARNCFDQFSWISFQDVQQWLNEVAVDGGQQVGSSLIQEGLNQMVQRSIRYVDSPEAMMLRTGNEVSLFPRRTAATRTAPRVRGASEAVQDLMERGARRVARPALHVGSHIIAFLLLVLVFPIVSVVYWVFKRAGK